jgi:hypothetical protein
MFTDDNQRRDEARRSMCTIAPNLTSFLGGAMIVGQKSAYVTQSGKPLRPLRRLSHTIQSRLRQGYIYLSQAGCSNALPVKLPAARYDTGNPTSYRLWARSCQI